jgi:hypothetical protein
MAHDVMDASMLEAAIEPADYQVTPKVRLG